MTARICRTRFLPFYVIRSFYVVIWRVTQSFSNMIVRCNGLLLTDCCCGARPARRERERQFDASERGRARRQCACALPLRTNWKCNKSCLCANEVETKHETSQRRGNVCSLSHCGSLALPLSLSFGGDETLTLLSQISCSDGDATSASPFARSASHSDSITPPQLRFMTVQNKFSHSHALSHSHPTTLAHSLTRCRWLVLICCCCFCCCCLRRRRCCCCWCYCSCRAFDILSLCLTFFALCGCFVCVPVRMCLCVCVHE